CPFYPQQQTSPDHRAMSVLCQFRKSISSAMPRVAAAGWLKQPLIKLIFSMLQPYQFLAEIFSPIKLGDGWRAMFNAVGNLFAVTELPVADPFGETFDRLHVAMLVIE